MIKRIKWSTDELDLLEANVDKDPRELINLFMEAGFTRSVDAITTKRYDYLHRKDKYNKSRLRAEHAPVEKFSGLSIYCTEDLVRELRSRGCEVTCVMKIEY